MYSINLFSKFVILTAILFCQTCLYADDVTATSYPTIGSSASGSVTITISGGFAPYTYSWTGPGGYTNNTMNIAALDSGEYCLTVTDAYCGTATVCTRVGYSNPNAIVGNAAFANTTVYPNPFTSELVILFSESIHEKIQICLYDNLGKEVYSAPMIPQNSQIRMELPSTIVAGSYLMVIRQDQEVLYTSKLLKN